MTIHDRNGVVAETKISSGARGRETPTGVFSILEKKREHYSNLYDSAPMPFMQRITWSGVAMHAGILPGYPASHGCIRLPYNFARQLYAVTKVGARVIVTQDEYEPATITHAKLLKPLPLGDAKALSDPASPIDANAPSGGAAPAGTAGSETGTIPSSAPELASAKVQHSDIGMLLGVTPASAEEPVPTQPKLQRTRVSVAAAKSAEIVRLADQLAAAEVYKETSAKDLAEAVRIAAEATNAYSDAKAIFNQIEAAIENTRREQAADETKLAASMRSANPNTDLNRMSEAAFIKAAERENAQENKVLDLALEIDTLIAEREQHRLTMEAAAKAADEKDVLRKKADRKVANAVEQIRKSKDALAGAKRAQARQDRPVTVFVSLKTGKLHVRQGYEPVLEEAVTIDHPEQPIGTHVFTALEYAQDQSDLLWNVVSVPQVAKAEAKHQGRDGGVLDMRQKAQGPVKAPSLQTAASALERLHIPTETMEKLEELVKPGSTLIISDKGVSNETGEYTDVIVSLR